MKHYEERKLVNGIPSVRVKLRESEWAQELEHPCQHCMLDIRNHDKVTDRQPAQCDSSCGQSYIWVDLVTWIAHKLEA